MTDFTPGIADPERVHMIQSSRTWSTLKTVAKAVAGAGETQPIAYVERRADEYRWSLAAKGGGYPLPRISARFLGVDHQRAYVGFRTLPDGTAILCEDPANVEVPDRWALLELGGSATAASVAWQIRTVLGGA